MREGGGGLGDRRPPWGRRGTKRPYVGTPVCTCPGRFGSRAVLGRRRRSLGRARTAGAWQVVRPGVLALVGASERAMATGSKTGSEP